MNINIYCIYLNVLRIAVWRAFIVKANSDLFDCAETRVDLASVVMHLAGAH